MDEPRPTFTYFPSRLKCSNSRYSSSERPRSFLSFPRGYVSIVISSFLGSAGFGEGVSRSSGPKPWTPIERVDSVSKNTTCPPWFIPRISKLCPAQWMAPAMITCLRTVLLGLLVKTSRSKVRSASMTFRQANLKRHPRTRKRRETVLLGKISGKTQVLARTAV